MKKLSKLGRFTSRMGVFSVGLLLSFIACAFLALVPVTRVPSDTDSRAIMPSDAPPPTVSHPPDIEYNQGETGNLILWSMTSSGTPGSYTINRNGTLVSSGPWDSSGLASISADGLPGGVYSFVLNATDNLGSTVDEVLVTVIGAPSIDWVVWVVVIGFAGVAALVVIKAIKAIPLRG